jgi:hypothetical protein
MRMMIERTRSEALVGGVRQLLVMDLVVRHRCTLVGESGVRGWHAKK